MSGQASSLAPTRYEIVKWRSLATILTLLSCLCSEVVFALHKDEVNITDFSIKTCGHGTITSASFCESSERTTITHGTNGYICGRSSSSGSILWRRNVCGECQPEIVWTGGVVVSLWRDVVRRWSRHGELVADTMILGGRGVFEGCEAGGVAVSTEEEVLWLNGALEVRDRWNIGDAVARHRMKPPRGTVPVVIKVRCNTVLLAFVPDLEVDTLPISNLLLAAPEMDKLSPLKNASGGTSILRNTLRSSREGKFLAVTESAALWLYSDDFGSKIHTPSSIHPQWTAIASVQPYTHSLLSLTSHTHHGTISALAKIQPHGSLHLIPFPHDSQPYLLHACTASGNVFIAALHNPQTYTVSIYRLQHQNLVLKSTLSTEALPSQHGPPSRIFLDCTAHYVLLSTAHGTTIHLNRNTHWMHHESLSSISQAIFIDYSHQRQTSILSKISHQSNKQALFGFQKLVLLLSSSHHCLHAVDTLPPHKSAVLYSHLLPREAIKHVMVHGNIGSAKGVHGAYFSSNVNVNDYPHVLLLSFLEHSVKWDCLHSVSAAVHSRGTIDLRNKNVLNIFPFWDTSDGDCPQRAMLLLDDQQVAFVPAQRAPPSFSSSTHHRGLFLHSVDKTTGYIRSYKFQPNSSQLQSVGQTLLHPSQEQILQVHYPNRNEVVQSPSKILGDDSLLIKYLNPHLIVIVSQITPSYLTQLEAEQSNEFFTALTTPTEKKKKPLGVTNATDPTTPIAPSIPTLFITLLDSVSCRVLHRITHSHTSAPLPPHTIPLTISENWILYAYWNHKTQRTDISSVTLYEGMIDKYSITAFSSPEQDAEMDSFHSAKPIALQKTFAVNKPVSAIGVTQTSRGITGRNFILAVDGVGWLWAVDSRFVDPRRPSGEVKAHEKTEGLIRYSPILPIIPQHILSHTLSIQGVQRILTSSARVESQSLVLAYGGPDIFFTRTAPSKGFDLLPDSFNKALLGIVVSGLLGGLFYIKRLSESKMLRKAWE